MKFRLRKTTGFDKIGFTFVEIMITFTLFMILASVGMGTYFRYYNFSLVNNDVSKVTKVLHNARFKAMKNPYNSNYGVYFSTTANDLIIFRDSYVPGNQGNEITELEHLNISDLNLLPSPGTTKNIIFENITGKTANAGTFTVSKDEFSFTFSINEQGAFEL